MRERIDIRRFPGARGAAWLLLLFLYAPVVVLVALSFNAGRTAAIWEGFSPRWYGVALDNKDILRAAQNSLVVAGAATLASTLLAAAAAVGMARRRFPGQDAVNATLALPLVIPEIITAVATLLFFNVVGFELGLTSVIVAHTVFCLPFAYLPIRARLDGMDRRLVEAAGDLYADPIRAFRRVTLPLLWPGILSGAMLAFIASLDDFLVAYFVAGPGSTTLPVYIFGMTRVGTSPEVNAISTLILGVSIVTVSLSFLIARVRAR
ncbi:putrescine/spermidine ABC transporter permease [Sorangium cellulosum]|uniref:Spermidine/putrescine transport system permease protein PotC n=1 Tax=Sorangium cellulosum TaxID=56 RepID=A0A2L0FBI4_SORCE|nr:ABC transporter permease [Sorangium cellulosum]AUX48789.1 putrescine/spermidine ABC transporter permease [Sorangium cellulosum]